MPPARFRLRTTMIAVASLAVLMGLFRLSAGIHIYILFVLVNIAVLRVAAVSIFALAVPFDTGVIQIFVFAIHSCRRRIRRREFSMTDSSLVTGTEAKRGAPDGVG
jgi:hypothetical protein